MSNFDESNQNQNLENILLYQPQGITKIYGHFKTEEKSDLNELDKETERQAQKELFMIGELGKEYSQSKDTRIPAKVGQFLQIWNEKFTVDDKFEVSPIDQRNFYTVWNTALKVWEELDENGKKSAEELATKVITNELAYFVSRQQQNKLGGYAKNFNSHSNANILAACVVLSKTESTLTAEALKIAIDGENSYRRLGVIEQVDLTIDDKGISDDFKERDSVHYHIFNQVALEKTVKVCEYLNIQLPEHITKKIIAAREFANKFILGTETHIEFANTQNKNDKQRFPDRADKNFDPKLDSYVVNEFKQALEEDFGI